MAPMNFDPAESRPQDAPGESMISNFLLVKSYSYSHLPVISGYNWDYTFYKWGYKYTYNW